MCRTQTYVSPPSGSSASCPPWSPQIAELQAEAEQARREEQAAKAVLQAAQAAAKEGRSLTREEVAEVENPILSVEEDASEPPKPPSGGLGGLFGTTRKVGACLTPAVLAVVSGDFWCIAYGTLLGLTLHHSRFQGSLLGLSLRP